MTKNEMTKNERPSSAPNSQFYSLPRFSTQNSFPPPRPNRQPRLGIGGFTALPYVPEDFRGRMDDGNMSEAETSCTIRNKKGGIRSRNSIPMGALTLNRSELRPLFEEDDPGIMSEAETSSTGRRRRQQQQQLPVVRTPSKTLERPLGLVFLIYRGETKRALLPNEITSQDTVKALFVRSFGKSLTMEYMDSPRVKIYIHDNRNDIFYELENLDEIKDRTILKLFEADASGRGPSGLGTQGLPPITNKDEIVDHGPVPRISLQNRSTTLPRNAFSAIESSLLSPLRPNLSHRSKTLSFMRGNPSRASIISSPGFSSIPEDRYYCGPGSTEEAKARMMHMETQLSQLTGMVEKALKHKKAAASGKKSVSFEKSVTFSDDIGGSKVKASPEFASQLRLLANSAQDLRQEVRVLRRLTQLQSMAMRDLVQDTYSKLRHACIAFSGKRVDEDKFSELNDLMTNLSHLENRVEDIRNGVINKKKQISLQDVENMALLLNQNSKIVANLRLFFPNNERLDNVSKRIKKLTSTLITLKRLASVQEQRIHSTENLSPNNNNNNRETTLDDLLDALQVDDKRISPVPAQIKTNAIDYTTPNKKLSLNGSMAVKKGGPPPPPPPRTSSSKSISETSSSSESINSQEGASLSRKPPPIPAKPSDLTKSRQDALEIRHQELLSRQRQLQEQYQRLQIMQENNKNKNISSFDESGKKIPPPLPVRNNSFKSSMNNNNNNNIEEETS